MSELKVLVKFSNGSWLGRILQLKSECFDLLCDKNLTKDCSVHRSEFISAKSLKNKTTVKCVLKNSKGVREFKTFDIEFNKSEDQNEFVAFLSQNKFIPDKKKKILVFVNPVSGRGKLFIMKARS